MPHPHPQVLNSATWAKHRYVLDSRANSAVLVTDASGAAAPFQTWRFQISNPFHNIVWVDWMGQYNLINYMVQIAEIPIANKDADDKPFNWYINGLSNYEVHSFPPLITPSKSYTQFQVTIRPPPSVAQDTGYVWPNTWNLELVLFEQVQHDAVENYRSKIMYPETLGGNPSASHDSLNQSFRPRVGLFSPAISRS
jgi:hypothetical protein